MKKVVAAVLVMSLGAVSLSARPAACAQFDDAKIVNKDGDYLGILSNKYDGDSIFNKYGTYGSKYAKMSIWNKYGDVGGKYSDKSPFNPLASKPPVVISGREVIAILSINDKIAGSVNPMVLAVTCFDYEPD